VEAAIANSEAARRVTLVERFLAFNDWPASRKVLLLGCLSSPTTLLAASVNQIITNSDTAPSAVNLQLLNPFLMVWLIAQVAVTVLAWIGVRTGSRSGVLAYLYAAINVPFIVAIIHLYGTMSTPFVAIVPTIVILWMLYFDEKVATFGMILMFSAITLVHVLEVQGTLPYAPMLVGRVIDAQRSASWFLAIFTAILILFTFSFSICLLLLAARRTQQRRLDEARDQLERSNRIIRRYLPSQRVDQIQSGAYVDAARPERRKLTVVFSEIEGFTEAAESLDPTQLSRVLNEYLSRMMSLADAHGATVNHLVGDSIMMFFGAPQATDDLDHALRAVRMTLQMQRDMEVMARGWMEQGVTRPLRARIGINTGYASVGDFGSQGRKIYTGIGVQTNLAARIQAHCEPGKVLISHPTWALVHERIPCDRKDEIQVKGVRHAVRVYELDPAVHA
jgi:class 3 adenylate cyclase